MGFSILKAGFDSPWGHQFFEASRVKHIGVVAKFWHLQAIVCPFSPSFNMAKVEMFPAIMREGSVAVKKTITLLTDVT